ncbi:MAG TPA: hypothetical protein VKO45_08490 [Methanomicrobiales archaeon]|nr:hypothetical protein [Methanomicrobiales archaeon]
MVDHTVSWNFTIVKCFAPGWIGDTVIWLKNDKTRFAGIMNTGVSKEGIQLIKRQRLPESILSMVYPLDL